MKKVIILTLLCTGCGSIIAPNPMQKGHIAVVADAEGMRAFGDTITGLVAEGKTPGEMKSSYFQHRDLRETEETKRAAQPGLLSNLFKSEGTVK